MRQSHGPHDGDSGVLRIMLEGNPYELGWKHGRTLKPQISNQLSIYRDMFWQNCKFDWTQVRTLAREFEVSIGRLAPAILEEMRGIADGVGEKDVDILDIIALNARSEIALGQWNDGCTALAWNLGDRRILAQNWDWRRSVGKNLALTHIKQDGKPEIWMVTEAGIVGKIGFNSRSVGVCLNAIRARPISTDLLPIHVLLRLALECSSASEAILKIETLGGAASAQHILIADMDDARSLELSPLGGVYIDEDANGIIVHTNHFLQNKLVDEPPWLSGSPIRLDRARELCAGLMSESQSQDELRSKLTPELLRKRVFADTYNAPQAICCSQDPSRGPQGAEVETVFNIVMTFVKGEQPRAAILFGKPGEVDEARAVTMPWSS